MERKTISRHVLKRSRWIFLAVLLTAKREFPKLQNFAVGKFSKAEEKQIQDYIERLMRDLELDDLTP